jgi:hypothetical protein
MGYARGDDYLDSRDLLGELDEDGVSDERKAAIRALSVVVPPRATTPARQITAEGRRLTGQS